MPSGKVTYRQRYILIRQNQYGSNLQPSRSEKANLVSGVVLFAAKFDQAHRRAGPSREIAAICQKD